MENFALGHEKYFIKYNFKLLVKLRKVESFRVGYMIKHSDDIFCF